MDGDGRCVGGLGVLIDGLGAEVVVHRHPDLLRLHGDGLRLRRAAVADEGQARGGHRHVGREPALLAAGHGLFRLPGEYADALPLQGDVGVDGVGLHIGRYLNVRLGLVAHRGREVVRDGDPHLAPGLHHVAGGLHRRLVGADYHVLHEGRHIDVVPAAVAQRLHRPAGPGRKGVGAVVGPGPAAGIRPVRRHLRQHGHHLRLRRVRQRRRRQAGDEQQAEQHCRKLLHFYASNPYCFIRP